MIDYGRIRSTIKPESKVIDEYSVWVNTDINEITVADDGDERIEFEFNQVRYEKNEYIKIMDNRNTELEGQITDTQLALCEVYELMV